MIENAIYPLIGLVITSMIVLRKKNRDDNMAELKIKGSKKYIKYLDKHLQKEHPQTKGKTKVSNKGKI